MKAWPLVFLILLLPILSLSQTEFSEDSARAIVQHLAVEIGPRPMGSPAEHEALLFAVSKFREYGTDTAYIMAMPHSTRVNTNSGIAVGIKKGASKRIILIGGHIDSAGPEIPGADDDGSGSATVMELARVFGKRSMQSTLVFCCFGGEEAGLEGSKYFADHFADLDSVALMLQADMANGLGVIDLDVDAHDVNAPKWLTSAAVEEFYKLGYEHLRYPTHFFSINYAGTEGSGSDHESFLYKGVPALDFSTDIAKPIHTPRDNFENFDPRGLKRTGDVFLKLVERFDGGTPSRSVDRYWLYLLGQTPIFVPIWGIWVFVAVAILVGVAAFISVRRRREDPVLPDRIRWSGLKIFFAAIVIVTCGWFTSDVLGIIRDVRNPWFTAIDLYTVLSFMMMAIAGWIFARSDKMRVSHCPYVFFKRSAIAILVFVVVLGLLTPKLMVEPAAALLLISLAFLARQALLKLVLLFLSPLWMFRLIFSEWRELIFRDFGIAIGLTPTSSIIFFDILAVVVGSLCVVPFLYSLIGVLRDNKSLGWIQRGFASLWTFMILVTAFVALASYALAIPVYNQLWYRFIRVSENYDLQSHDRSVTLQSGEYLSDLSIHQKNVDTTISARTTFAKLQPDDAFDTTWLRVERRDDATPLNDSMVEHHITLSLRPTQLPYQVFVTYSNHGKTIQQFSSRWFSHNDDERKRLEWTAFPDTPLVVPVSFQLSKQDSVQEIVEAIFVQLADPIRYDQEMTYFIPRTRFVDTHYYTGKGN